MNPRPAVRAFLFDAYGTLFDPFSVQALCEKLFPGRGPQLSQLWRAKQLEYSWLRSLMGRYVDFWQLTRDALAFACRSLGLTAQETHFTHLMDAYLHLDLYPDVLPALDKLSKVPLSILSNGSPQMLNGVVENAGLKGRFAHVLSVDAAEIYKPSPTVYQLGVQKTGLPKEAIGFVSSNFWDICGATSFGFRTFWINRSGAVADELGLAPAAVVGSLLDLAAV